MAGTNEVAEPLRVLLIEDDVSYAELVLEMLAAELPCAELSASATQAGARAALAADPDVVIADLSLPDAEGLEVVGALRTACPRTAVLVLTRHDDGDFALEAIRAGADDCLVKGGHDAAQLGTAVRRVAPGTARLTVETWPRTSGTRWPSSGSATPIRSPTRPAWSARRGPVGPRPRTASSPARTGGPGPASAARPGSTGERRRPTASAGPVSARRPNETGRPPP